MDGWLCGYSTMGVYRMVLYTNEIEFHRYYIWYTCTRRTNDAKVLLKTNTPGYVWSMNRTGHDPCTVGARPTRGRDRRTTGPVVVVRTRRRPHSSSWARARPGWTSRTGRRAKGSNAGGGARRYGCETRDAATRSGDETTGARARGGAFERGGRTTTDGKGV